MSQQFELLKKSAVSAIAETLRQTVELQTQEQIDALSDEVTSALASGGWVPAEGSFETGGVITARNQFLTLTTAVGQQPAGSWTWGGNIPVGGYVVPPGSSPETSGGIAPNAWVYRNDTTLVGRHNSDPAAHPELSAFISSEANRAENAAEAAQLNAGIYPDILTGLAAVQDDKYFSVPSAENSEYLILYHKQSNVAVEIKRYPSVSAITKLEDSERLAASYPNLFSRQQLDFEELPTLLNGTRNLEIVDALPLLRINTNTVSGVSDVYWRFLVSSLNGASSFSFTMTLHSVTLGTSGRVFIDQRNSASVVVSTDTVVSGLSNSISSPLDIKIENVLVNQDAEFIDIRIQLNNSSGDKTRTAFVRSMCLRAGGNGAFVQPYIPEIESIKYTATQALNTATEALDMAAPAPAVPAREASRFFKNVWPDPVLRDSGESFTWGQGGPTPIVSKNGFRCLETPSSPVATNRRKLIDVSGFKSGKFSVSVVVHEKIGDQGANGIRVRLTANSSSNINDLIIGAWQGYPAGDTADTNYYTKLLPQTDITSPLTIVVCEGFDIPAGATHIGLDLRIETTVQAYISHIVVREGSDASYRDEYNTKDIAEIQQIINSINGGINAVSISPTGDDINGDGTLATPFSTLNRAIDAVNGNGVVYVTSGTYAPQQITPSKVKGRVDIIGQRNSLNTGQYGFPVINLANKLTGITKTTGRTKVYQATVSGLPSLANFNWAYQGGVADPRTLIPNNERNPQHKGRTHRLQNFTKLIKTTAGTLNDALSEMDSDPLPKAFVDSGILYFTIVGGGDGAAADIYLDAQTGLVSPATRGMAGELNITGLDVRYGGVDLRPFVKSHVDELTVQGSRLNCVDYNVLSYGTLEVCASGSQGGTVGDGLNGHAGAVITSGADLYSHDCQDDGFSDHAGCTSRLQGGVVEYNGGGGLTPAYGSDHVAVNFISRKNQRIPGRKPGAFCVVGTPAQGSPADGGVDTLAYWINCIDIESETSFADSTNTEVNAVAISCKSIRPTVRAYAVSKIIDCGYIASGSSTAKASHTVVENTGMVE